MSFEVDFLVSGRAGRVVGHKYEYRVVKPGFALSPAQKFADGVVGILHAAFTAAGQRNFAGRIGIRAVVGNRQQ